MPADDKNNLRLVVPQIVLDTFEAMKLANPKAGLARLNELKAMRAEFRPQRFSIPSNLLPVLN
jgi:hypothetical protein